MPEQNKRKTARIMSGLTLEEAAEKLYISVSTLKRIERGTQPSKKDIDEAMAGVYGTPWITDQTVPDNYRPLSRAEATLKYINERDDVEALLPRARRILADGIIDESERNEFAEIEVQIKEERIAARDLLYAH